MVDKKIVKYIDEQKNKGVSPQKIKNDLSNAGWDSNTVDKAFNPRGKSFKKYLLIIPVLLFLGFVSIYFIDYYYNLSEGEKVIKELEEILDEENRIHVFYREGLYQYGLYNIYDEPKQFFFKHDVDNYTTLRNTNFTFNKSLSEIFVYPEIFVLPLAIRDRNISSGFYNYTISVWTAEPGSEEPEELYAEKTFEYEVPRMVDLSAEEPIIVESDRVVINSSDQVSFNVGVFNNDSVDHNIGLNFSCEELSSEHIRMDSVNQNIVYDEGAGFIVRLITSDAPVIEDTCNVEAYGVDSDFSLKRNVSVTIVD